MKTFRIFCTMLVCLLWVAPVFSQGPSTKSMQIVRDAVKSNKKACHFTTAFRENSIRLMNDWGI